ncbi:MAG: hypothetical protein CSA75_03990 [Sorangium cellulosum]|nr:MAG: hypothetical protein CSA75_03990 [Sorangium cellulosum]
MENELEIVCQDCGVTFLFTPKTVRGRTSEPPNYCSICRAEHSKSVSASPQPKYTGDTNEYRSPMAGDFPPPRRSRPRRRPTDSSDSQNKSRARYRHRRRPMFSAVCSSCGATAHVPFQPSKFQEVLCRACFQQMRGRAKKASEPSPT